MSSLSKCLKKMGLAEHEAAILKGLVDDELDSGYAEHKAATRAVRAYIKQLEDEREDIIRQAKEAGWDGNEGTPTVEETVQPTGDADANQEEGRRKEADATERLNAETAPASSAQETRGAENGQGQEEVLTPTRSPGYSEKGDRVKNDGGTKEVDGALWRSEARASGGPLAILLTQAGKERAFRVGTGKAVEGPLLDALERLYGGRQKVDSPGMNEVPLMHPWIKRDGEWVSLSDEGVEMVKRGLAEQARLLDRVKSGIPLQDGGTKETPTNTEPEVIKEGDRVELTSGAYAGRHGEVIKASRIGWQSAFGGPTTDVTSFYEIRTDNGKVVHAGSREVAPELSRPERVTPDILIRDSTGSRVESPDNVLREISRKRGDARNKIAAAERARKQDRIDDLKQDAAILRKEADEIEAAFYSWAVEHNAAAADALGFSSMDDGRLSHYLRAKASKYKTAGQELTIKLFERDAKANASKWSVGDGVGWKVTQDQINRGFRIAEIDATKKMARITQVSDTGLTSSGGDFDRMGDQWVSLGSLVRDNKYNEQKLEEAPPAKAEDEPPQDVGPVESFKKSMVALFDGNISVEDYRAAYRSVRDNKDAVKADLNKLSKDTLMQQFGIRREGKKAEFVDSAYETMLRSFALDKEYGSSSYFLTPGAYAKHLEEKQRALDALVEAQTEEDLANFAKEVAANREERATRRANLKASIENPQSLEDFRNFIRYHKADGKTFTEARMMLTPEQRAQYDELLATSTREARGEEKEKRVEVRVAGQKVDAKIIETKHTQKGHDLFVVQMAERVSREDYETLNASAKKLGGYYSSFRGRGAVPGFQFRERSAAEAFAKLANGDASEAKEVAESRRDAFEDDRSQTAAQRLREMADRMDENADEVLSRDRKVNTERRARMASSAEAGANAAKAMAKTMRNIADALESGKAKFLDRVRTKSQVELLQGIVSTAKNNELRAKYPSYAEQEKRRGQPPTGETADYADFPKYTAFRSDLASLARQLLEVDGTKKIGQSLMNVADDMSDAFKEFAKKPGNLFRLSAYGVKSGETVRAAIFPDKDTAERAIRKGGLSGKAIVFQEKRGVNHVILSPSEAIARGIWEGDGDKRITLSDAFGAEMVEKIGRANRRGSRVSVPWQFESTYDRRKALSRLGIETPAEFRAALREFIGLREQAAEVDRIKALERAMVGRAKDGLDFFPTAEAVADEMVEAADIKPEMSVLEPSAGMGHLADRIRAAGAEPDVVELSADRRELLREKGYHLMPYEDFLQMEPRSFFTFGDIMRAPDGVEGIMHGGGWGSGRASLHEVNPDGTEGRMIGWYDRDELVGVRHRGVHSGYDRIVMNPPFSNNRDIEHVQHAYKLLKPGGRLVALMGEGAFFRQDKKAEAFREWLAEVGGTSEKLAEGSFMDPSLPVNTGVNARMVVIDKPEVMPSIGDSRGTGETPESIRESLVERFGEEAVGSLERSRILKILRNHSEIPAGIEIDSRARGFYDPETGVAYLFADRLTPQTAQAVMLHEIGEHYGLRTFLGEKGWKTLGTRVRLMAAQNGSQAAAVWAAIKANYPEFQGRENADLAQDERFMHELIAALGETQAFRKTSAWQQIVSAIKAFFLKMGFSVPLTDADVGRILEGSLKKAARDAGLRPQEDIALGDDLDQQTRFLEEEARKRGFPTLDEFVEKDFEGFMSAGEQWRQQHSLASLDQTKTEAFNRWFSGSKIVDKEGRPLVVYHRTGDGADINVFRSRGPQDVWSADGEEVQRADSWDMGDDRSGAPDAYHYMALSWARQLGVDAAMQQAERDGGSNPGADSKRIIRDLRRLRGKTVSMRTEVRENDDGFYFTPDRSYSFIRKEGPGSVYPVYLDIKNPIYLNGAEIEGAGLAWKMKEYEAQGYDGAIYAEDKNDLERPGWDGYKTQIVAFRPEQIKSAIANAGTFDPSNPNILQSRSAPTFYSELARRIRLGPGTREDGKSAGSSPLYSIGLGDLNAQQEAAVTQVLGKPPSLLDRARSFRETLARDLAQGLFDQFAPLKALSPRAYMLARMSKGGDSTLESAFLYGRVFVDKQGFYRSEYTDRARTEGFAGKMAKLKGEHDRFLLWIAAQRAELLTAEQRENLFKGAHIAALKSLVNGTMKDGTVRRPLYEQAARDLNEFNNSFLKVARDSKLISQELHDYLKDRPYVPFYRMVEDGTVSGFGNITPGLVGQYFSKKLKGGTERLNEDLLANVLRNWSHVITASARNRAAILSLKAAEKAGVAERVGPEYKGNDRVRFMGDMKMPDGTIRHGEIAYRVVDPNVFDAVTSLEYAGLGAWSRPFTAAKRYLTIGVTASPTFKIRNLFRDSIQAIASSELSANPLENVKKGWQAVHKDSEVRAQMLAAGGMIRFGSMLDGANSDRAQRLIDRGVDPEMILDSDTKIEKFWKHRVLPAIEAYQEFGDRGEQVNRAALYMRLMEKGMSHGEAAFWARDLMDFSMSGKWAAVRTLVQLVPFMNARLQGLYKLGRATKQDWRRMAYTLGAVSLASAGLLLAYNDDDDWKKRPDWDRDNFWWFKVGDYAFRLPKPFEIGAIGTLAERALEYMISDEMTGERFGKNMRDLVMNQLSLNPVPQLVKPLADLYANKDSFTGRAIEGLGMQNLRPEDRATSRTSEVAKFLGQLGLPNPAELAAGRYTPLSPVQFDFLAKAYFGWLGTATVTALDYGIRPMVSEGERPSMQLRDVFLVGNFMETLPSGSSRYVNQLYEQAKEIEEAYGSYRDALKRGDKEGAAKVMAEEGDLISKRRGIEAVKARLAEVNRQERRVESDKAMSGDEKRAELSKLDALKDRLARRVAH